MSNEEIQGWLKKRGDVGLIKARFPFVGQSRIFLSSSSSPSQVVEKPLVPRKGTEDLLL